MENTLNSHESYRAGFKKPRKKQHINNSQRIQYNKKLLICVIHHSLHIQINFNRNSIKCEILSHQQKQYTKYRVVFPRETTNKPCHEFTCKQTTRLFALTLSFSLPLPLFSFPSCEMSPSLTPFYNSLSSLSLCFTLSHPNTA